MQMYVHQAAKSSRLVSGLPHVPKCNHYHLFTDSRTIAVAVVSEAAVFEVCCLLLLYGVHRVSVQEHQTDGTGYNLRTILQ
jgi:hypothetical protein